MFKKFLAVFTAIGIMGSFTACGNKISQGKSSDSKSDSEKIEVTEEETTEATEPAEDSSVRIVAAGDNLVQTAVYRTAQERSTDGTYDFTYCYENVKDIISAGDISVLNQETLICGGDYEVTGTDFNFNSPPELGEAMVDLGFDVFTMGNNHVLDKGEDGLLSSLDYWDGIMAEHSNVRVLGAYRNQEDMNNIRTIEMNGMTVAFLNFTEHTNGYSLSDGSDIRIVYTYETDLMQRQIAAAKEVADVVVVSAHWGNEDTFTVSDEVKALAQNLVDWGADVIIGTHSHTAETMEYLEREDGTKGFVFYSLGNFISAQTDNFNMVGEIADFTVTKDGETGEVTVDGIQVTPVITHYDDGHLSNLRIYPYSMYNEELASSHGIPYSPLGTQKDFSMDIIDNIVDNNIPAEFRKLD